MKRAFFLLISFFLFTNIYAQDFKGGLRVGVDASQVNGDNLTGFNKAGIIAGTFVSRQFSDKISLQMEMVYIQKGSRKPTDDYNTYYVMRVHYIEVPVLFKFHASKKLILYTGPSFGTLIFSEEEDQFGIFKDRPEFKKFEFAGNAGFMYSLSDNWLFDGRYSHSISTIRPYTGGPTTFFDKGQYNVLIEFSLLYLF